MIERISTQRLAPQQRLDFWNRIVGETVEGLLVDSDVARFDAAMLRWRLDDMTMIWPQSCGATVRRRREAAQAATSQKLVVHIAQEATAVLTEPSNIPANPPRPWLPTTTSCDDSDCLMR